ncbi:cell division protein FtsB [Gallaecimonas sp. GXIMD4217]|uniref:cell division protein FtsB n=1 Tax=Gallaecimonas sp. GXIMD4217 TaxID=3131927 RepID=UPI00311B3B37
MRIFTLLLLVLLGLLQYRLWWGDNSVQEHLQLKADIKRVQAQNAELRKRNQLMYVEVQDLRSATAALEERARKELGMIREGETFYRVIPAQTN